MKRIALIPVLAGLLALTACNKVDTDVCAPVSVTAPAAEVSAVREFLASKNITAQEDSRGFFYTIRQAGGSAKPSVCSNVQVTYSGTLTNGDKFDGASQISFNLSRLITGWQAGIPLIGAGGSITLYLPPSLAYGAKAQDKIPANSILIFDIDLLQFN